MIERKMNTCNIIMCLVVASLLSDTDATGTKDSSSEKPHVSANRNLRLEKFSGVSGEVVYAEEMWMEDREESSGGISGKCMELLGAFSNATTNFLSCIMTNARPLQYCQHCVGEFSSVINTYDAICNDDENGTTCQNELLRADNVQVVLLAYDFVQGVWEKSTCHNCYNSTRINDTTVYRPTEDTLIMLKKIKHTQDCFHDFADNTPINETVCTLCRDFYSQANSYYNKLDEEGKLCSDLKDSMNYTRRMWSKKFKCIVALRNDLTIYSLAVAIGFLPAMLYIGAFVFGTRLQKKRRDSVPHNSPGSSGTSPLNTNPVESET